MDPRRRLRRRTRSSARSSARAAATRHAARSSSTGCATGSGARAGRQIFDDLSEFDDPDSPTTISRTFRYGRANGPGAGNVVLDKGSFKPTGPRGLALAARPRWASNFLMVGASRSATGHPLFVGRPADRLHVPRPDDGGRHQLPRRAGARRDGAGLRRQRPDRPRAGLRVEPHVGRLGPDRHVRRDAVRRLADEVPLQGPLPDDGPRRRGHGSPAPGAWCSARPCTGR